METSRLVNSLIEGLKIGVPVTLVTLVGSAAISKEVRNQIVPIATQLGPYILLGSTAIAAAGEYAWSYMHPQVIRLSQRISDYVFEHQR